MDLLINLEGKRCQEAFHAARLAIQHWQSDVTISNKPLMIVSIDNQIEKNIAAYLGSEYKKIKAKLIQLVPLTDELRRQLQSGWREEYELEDVKSAKFGKVIMLNMAKSKKTD